MTEIEIVDGTAFDEGLASVRNDATDDKFIVCCHADGDPNRLQTVQVGQSTADMKFDDSQVMYALGRYEIKFDMSINVKFVYFRWIGDKVPHVKLGRYGVVRGSVEHRFTPYHMFVESSNLEDFDDDVIMQQLEETSGTKSKVLESTEGRQMRGFTQTQLPSRDNTAKFGVLDVARAGAPVQVDPAVEEAVASVRADSSDQTWLLAGYQDNSPKGPIVLVGSGSGDLSELKALLDSNASMYGLYRVTDQVDDITTVKFVYILWIGESTKPMTKAKISTHRGFAEQIFCPAHVTIVASDLSDISDSILMNKVKSASGTKSHVK